MDMNFTPDQIKDLSAGKPVTVLVEMEQPPEMYRHHIIQHDRVHFYNGDLPKDLFVRWYARLPHPVGSTMEVREEWRVPCQADIINAGVMFYFVRSDFNDELAATVDWQPASTMPDELIMRPKVMACEVKRVQSFLLMELCGAGIIDHPDNYKNYKPGRLVVDAEERTDAIRGPGAWKKNPYVCLVTVTMEVEK